MQRPRRLRMTPWVRELVAETNLSKRQLVQPYFLARGENTNEPIKGFSGVNRLGSDTLARKIENDLECGLRTFLLFGGATDEEKDREGRAAYREDSLIAQNLVALRKRFGSAVSLMSDVCLCPYTEHGHCGVLREEVENDLSLEPLSKMALVHAQAGADFVAPSDMMDGRIGAIRRALDGAGLTTTGIMAYTAKYSSAYYGPFREALSSSPKGMSRASYQMDFRNTRDALRELRLDIDEGADIVMVKPALAYLDIIAAFRAQSDVPVAAYSVSGEYQMVKALAQSGMADEKSLALENLTAISRAGAQVIITYFASIAAAEGWLHS